MTIRRQFLNKFIYLFIIMIVVFNSLGLTSKEDKIYSNIKIENIEVGKLTKSEAMEKLRETYPVKSFIITYEDKKWIIKPEDIDLNYNIEQKVEEAFKYTRSSREFYNLKRKMNLNLKKYHNIKLKATYNEVKLSEQIDIICKVVNLDYKDATFCVEPTGEIKTTKSKEGMQVNVNKLKEDMYEMINKKEIKDIGLPVVVKYPRISTEQVKSINTILGQYSTSFNEHTSRGSNIHVAGESTSEILLMPEETFSYNKHTGARNWVNGYKSAPVIVGGKVTRGEGGGVCQVSTTIYNAALIAGLYIDEVHNHSIPSRYVPKGRDATVSYGYIDLKFSNPYTHPIYIKNIMGKGAITTKIYGCDLDRQRISIKMIEEYTKDKITVQTYRLYLDEENNVIQKELVNTSIYKSY